jgi:predicted HTH transcriptional regulator
MLQEIYHTLKNRQGEPSHQNVGVNVGVKSEILNYLKKDPTLSAKELATLLNKTQRTIERNIKELREQGLLTREGSDKTGIWIV